MKIEKIPLTLRLDSRLHDALKIISEKEMRSLNTQIEFFLRGAIVDYCSADGVDAATQGTVLDILGDFV